MERIGGTLTIRHPVLGPGDPDWIAEQFDRREAT